VQPLSWRSPKTEVRASSIHGRGVFATASFEKDEVVLVKGGHIIEREQLKAINAALGPVEIQIGDNLFIAPLTSAEREGSMLYSNHSCAANLGLRGSIIFVAMRDIAPGDELTHDWCCTDDGDYSEVCRCGATNCRKVITGKDWQKSELQRRYDGYFSSYLIGKIKLLSNIGK